MGMLRPDAPITGAKVIEWMDEYRSINKTPGAPAARGAHVGIRRSGEALLRLLGPPVVPFLAPFLGEGSRC